jgi:eukaryotic-like serine/threonine-protein kinase
MAPMLFTLTHEHCDGKVKGPKRQVVVYPDRPIGKEGGFGKVFMGHYANQPNVQLAVKVLKPELCNNPKTRERFRREGCHFRDIRHPNLVETEGYVEEGGRCFVVTKYIKGKTLQEILDDSNNTFSNEQIIQNYLVPLLHVLDFLHRQHRVVHRDLKATNIIVEQETGQLKLIDLGIAKIMDLPAITQPGEIGPRTEQYAPPEMIKYDKPITPATDLYSVGILLYLLLTRRLPFVHANTEALYQLILTKSLPYNNLINEQLWVILNKLTQKNIEMRYQSVEELRIDLFPPPSQANLWGESLKWMKSQHEIMVAFLNHLRKFNKNKS